MTDTLYRHRSQIRSRPQVYKDYIYVLYTDSLLTNGSLPKVLTLTTEQKTPTRLLPFVIACRGNHRTLPEFSSPEKVLPQVPVLQPIAMASINMLISFGLVAAIVSTVSALTCYENDAEGNRYEVTNSTYKYCALIPETETSRGRLFGLGPESDWTEAYDHMFNMSDSVYRILTVCILERYDFGQIYASSYKEFMFRCVCNYDRCNSDKTFNAYLHGVKAQSSDEMLVSNQGMLL
uniref:Uncharacterized protein n=1 Tax=Steinernema glaseri TaxID=37863 RepID=A0A1I8AI02_9BILA